MKKRHYTVQQMGDSPYLTIKGKFLTQEFGLKAGDYFQLAWQGDCLILTKTQKEEVPPTDEELRIQKLAEKKAYELYKQRTKLAFSPLASV